MIQVAARPLSTQLKHSSEEPIQPSEYRLRRKPQRGLWWLINTAPGNTRKGLRKDLITFR